MRGDFRLFSRPVRLSWAGWETDTYRLQQAGWDLSAHQDIARQSMQIAFRSPHGDAQGISSMIDHDYMLAADPHRTIPPHLGAQVMMGRRVELTIMGEAKANYFSPIDAIPQWGQMTRTSLEDFAHFARAPLVMNNPLVVPEEDVQALMERILKLQQPDRTARIQAALRNPEGYERLPQQKFHAQIISFGDRAAA